MGTYGWVACACPVHLAELLSAFYDNCARLSKSMAVLIFKCPFTVAIFSTVISAFRFVRRGIFRTRLYSSTRTDLAYTRWDRKDLTFVCHNVSPPHFFP